MNLLPSDLRKVIGRYIRSNDLGTYCQLIPNCEQFLIERAIIDLGLPKNLILEIWDTPEQLYNLTPYENYIRVSSYFGIVLPGPEKFLNLKFCYQLAVSNNAKETANYFGTLLHHEAKKIKSDLNNSFSREGKFYQKGYGKGPTAKEYDLVSHGQMPEAIVPHSNPSLVAVLFGQYDLAEQLVSQEAFPERFLENNLFIRYMVKGRLQELEQTFPELPPHISQHIVHILREIYQIEKNIKPEVLYWLAYKINPQVFLLTLHPWYLENPLVSKMFALVYYLYPEIVRTDLKNRPTYLFNLTRLPIYFYVSCKLNPPTPDGIKGQVGKFFRTNYNPENVNILANTLNTMGDVKIGMRKASQIAKTIIKKAQK